MRKLSGKRVEAMRCFAVDDELRHRVTLHVNLGLNMSSLKSSTSFKYGILVITLSIVPVISSFSTKGRNRETNSWLYGGAIVSNTSVTKYLRICTWLLKSKRHRLKMFHLISEMSVSVFLQHCAMYFTTGRTYPLDNKLTNRSTSIFLISISARFSMSP